MEVLTEALSNFDRYQGAVMAIPSAEVRRRGLGNPADALRVYGASLAITGVVQPFGDNLRCSLQLVDTASERQIGAATFDYDPANPRAAKNQAVEHTARLLGLHLRPDTAKLSSAADSGTPAAYSAYLEGRGLLARYDVTGNVEKAIASFRRAVEIDPNFVLAWSSLGAAYWRQGFTVRDKEKVISRWRARNMLSGSIRAWPLSTPCWAWSTAERAAMRTRSGNFAGRWRSRRKNADAPRELGRIYANLGRFAEAEASYLKATQARPTDWYGFLQLGIFYQDRERYKEAETAYRRASEFAPAMKLRPGISYRVCGDRPV
jgi:tetratricopeptide (TPR) repeat protein